MPKTPQEKVKNCILSVLDSELNPLDWGVEHCSYSVLAKLAKKYLICDSIVQSLKDYYLVLQVML